MITKMLEIRDRGTCIPVLAIQMTSTDKLESAFLSRAGFGEESHQITVVKLHEGKSNWDPFKWKSDPSRTMFHAHFYIEEHWNELENGQVVDIRTILGETDTPAENEILVGI